MYATTYHRASSVADATGRIAADSDAKYLAGGQTLIPTMKARLASPSEVVDVTHISDMKGITVSDGSVTIGAATTHADVAGSADVAGAIPALAKLASGIGDPAVRNRGTIGGSIANNDPAADYPAAALGLGATIKTNQREISADDFFVGLFETALGDGEMIVSVTFPVPEKAAYTKFPNPASRYAMVGVMAAKTAGGARVAVTGAGSSGVFRASGMEQALNANWSSGALDGQNVDAASMLGDLHGSNSYRAHLVGVMAKRAVNAA